MQHIGIIACSAEGAALCYRTICIEGATKLGAKGQPEVSLHGHSLAAYEQYLDCEDWEGVGSLMLESANRLATAGADFLICPDNTIHQALPLIESQLPRPFLHIARVVAKHAHARGFRKVGLTGTRWLMASEVYPCALREHDIAFERPTDAERLEMSLIIMDELVCGVFEPASVEFLRGVIKNMQARGCDAAALGCTEIPLIINEANASLPVLDSTRLLARAAIDRAAADLGNA